MLVILMERLVFGTYFIGRLLTQHVVTSGLQLENIMGSATTDGTLPGNVDLFMNNPEMLMGLVIAGIMYPVIVWLRNHRFEI